MPTQSKHTTERITAFPAETIHELARPLRKHEHTHMLFATGKGMASLTLPHWRREDLAAGLVSGEAPTLESVPAG
jgi:hypothetical protein